MPNLTPAQLRELGYIQRHPEVESLWIDMRTVPGLVRRHLVRPVIGSRGGCYTITDEGLTALEENHGRTA